MPLFGTLFYILIGFQHRYCRPLYIFKGVRTKPPPDKTPPYITPSRHKPFLDINPLDKTPSSVILNLRMIIRISTLFLFLLQTSIF